ncbi:MAG TPA: CBS domain-containing protein [Longimicrobiales bacterium]|nr:CBS domain-containing protein [Longimicrobiales bacterium]
MKARELMTSNPECVTRDESLQRAAQIMRDLDVGFVPVVDDHTSMRLTGVITDRDIAVRAVADGRSDGRVADCMTSGSLRTVSPDDSDNDVMRAMRDAQVRRIPVVEEGNRLVGIIAQADIATEGLSDRKVGQTVEEISEPGRPRGRS